MNKFDTSNAVISLLNMLPDQDRTSVLLNLAGIYAAERKMNGDTEDEICKLICNQAGEIAEHVEQGTVRVANGYERYHSDSDTRSQI